MFALSARDGTELWRYTANGRVDSPPTIHNGTVLFGSADGSVYCLDAENGDLAWRFHAAPGSRRVCSFGQLESAWPVHGSVLVKNGVVYFAAGRSSYLDGGIFLYGLDPTTGKVLHQAHLDRPPQDWDKLDTNPVHVPGALSDILLSYKDGMVMRTKGFSDQLVELAKTWGSLRVTGGFLDDSYFKRFPWGLPNIGQGAQLVVLDETVGYSVRMRRSDKALYLSNDAFFKPGAKGYALAATDLKKRKELWSIMVPVRIQAMVSSKQSLFVAGPPDLVDPQDPLGAFEGRKGGRLWAIAKESGAIEKKYELEAPPVFNGMAAAGGRLFVALANGTVVCMEGE